MDEYIKRLKPYMRTIKKIAKKYNIDYRLVCAVCIVESGVNTYANRFEPNWKWFVNPNKWSKVFHVTKRTHMINQAMSFGLMQVMGAVALELGIQQNIPSLVDPKIGIEFGTKKLAQLIYKYQNLPELEKP